MYYVYLSYGSKNFITGKSAVVGVEKDFEHITDYILPAKQKLCSKMGYNETEIDIFDWSFLGKEFSFIK